MQECNDDESREQLEETRHTWNLIHALWGQLCDLEDSMMDLDQATGVCFCRMEKKVKKIFLKLENYKFLALSGMLKRWFILCLKD